METTLKTLYCSNTRCTRGWLQGGVFSLEILEQRSGIIIARAIGESAELTFRGESGGHRVQRVPPTEKRGRVHTSTITIAVLGEVSAVQMKIEPKDLEFSMCRASGKGGQGVNTTDSAVQVKHIPTGLTVRSETERSQNQNKESAVALLRARLWEAERNRVDGERASHRKQLVGSGMRGDKVRTLRFQDDSVVCHVTGRRWRLRDYLKGEW